MAKRDCSEKWRLLEDELVNIRHERHVRILLRELGLDGGERGLHRERPTHHEKNRITATRNTIMSPLVSAE